MGEEGFGNQQREWEWEGFVSLKETPKGQYKVSTIPNQLQRFVLFCFSLFIKIYSFVLFF